MMKVSELIKLLECAQPYANVYVRQPRSWVKKQPDATNTDILSVEVGRCVQIKTV